MDNPILSNKHRIIVILCLLLHSCHQPQQSPNNEASTDDEWVEIFDGKSLDGWSGDSTYWSVRNGSLFGEITPETLVKRNTFIIWQGDVPADFELKVTYRVSEFGNSGINYRSEPVEGIPYALRGYQADLDGSGRLVGSNYEERRRTTLASQGEIVNTRNLAEDISLEDHTGNNFWLAREVKGSHGTPESLQEHINKQGWNQYHLIVRGNRMKHFVNGVLMSDVIDNDTLNRRADGLLGVQVHVGPPMTVEYRNFRIKAILPF